MSYDLAISLGHNSSAVLIKDGHVLAGYEEERFTGIKADSRYPVNAIEELKARYQLPKDTNAFIGHWFIDAQLPEPNKYWDPIHLRALFPNGSVDSLSADFTHHHSHLESAMAFAKGPGFPSVYTAVVADGFGSFGECITVYEVVGNSYRVIQRVFGFEKSMGMLYQYATAFMGMKMHNHEYKMLAYEVHIREVLEFHDIQYLKEMILTQAEIYLRATRRAPITNQFDPVTDLSSLANLQVQIHSMLSKILDNLNIKYDDTYKMRVVTSYFVQHVVESVICGVIAYHQPKHLLVVGGLFYNVKINHILANSIPGRFCAMPLAGDQGAALGVYQAYKGDLVWPDTLCWGTRDLVFNEADLPKGVVLVNDEIEAQAVMRYELNSKGWVNLVRGGLEFGPRALCNTSTIALPDPNITAKINLANDRTMEMPMAPVMTKTQADDYFIDCDKVHKSLDYMIVTRAYKLGMAERVLGAAHYYPEENVFTGRPQITADPLMVNLLGEYGPLVNTSFNFHGVPIVRSQAQILDTHVKQWDAAPESKPTTVIIRG